jgi:predicted aminopeptidase
LMMRNPKNGRRCRKWLLVLALLLAVLAVSGCETLSFYTQAIKGQYAMITHQRPVEKVLADPGAPRRLKEQLQLLQDLLALAGKDLKLVVDGHYRK